MARSLEEAFFALTGGGEDDALLRAELIKLRTTRTFIALTGAAVGTSVLITVLVGVDHRADRATRCSRDVFTSDTSGLFILILAVIGITGEWRHHTITSSLLASPDRIRFLAAKTIAFAVAGLVLSMRDLRLDRDRRATRSCRRATCRRPSCGDLIEQFAPQRGDRGAGRRVRRRPRRDRAQPGRRDRRAAGDRRSPSSRSSSGSRPTSAASVRSARCPRRRRASHPRTPACRRHPLLDPGPALLLLLAWIGSAFAIGAALLLKSRDLE